MLLALAVLIGWGASIDTLKSVLPGYIAMNPLTAVNFAALGLGVLVIDGRATSLRITRVAGVLVCVVAIARMSEYLWHTDLQVDRLLFTAQLDVSPHFPPTRMAPNTAICQLVLGAGLALFGVRIGKISLSEALAAPAMLVALFAVVGYAYGIRTLYRVGPFVPMAVHTAVALFAMSFLQRTDEQRPHAQDALELVVERLARSNAELERLATTDGLTGALNRRAWLERFEAEIARAKRYDLPLSVLMIDADHFKRVNDQYGHLVGDDVLRALTQVFMQRLRQTDVLGRYGGEEFCILLPNTSLDGATVVAERLSGHVRDMGFTTDSGARIHLSCSIGVADFAAFRPTSAEVLGAADLALYAAKTERGCIRAAVSHS